MTPRYSIHAPGKYRKRIDQNADHFIRIDSGRYKDICFTFGDIRAHEQVEVTRVKRTRTAVPIAAKIDFDFDILFSPLKRVKREAFLECLTEILEKELQKRTDEVVDIDEIVVGDTPDLNSDIGPEEFQSHEIISA